MSNFQTFAAISQGVPGTAPRLFTCVTTDALSTILAAGYLNDLGDKVKSGDQFLVNYLDTSNYPTTQVAVYGQFMANLVGSNMNLIPTASGATSASVSVPLASFLGMYAAPVQIVPAPGANLLIVLKRAEIIMTYGSAALAAGGVVAFQYDSTVHGAGVAASNTEQAADFFATASTTFAFVGVSGNTVGALPFSTTVNKGLYLSNATQPFTTGTGSSFVVKASYDIIPVA